MSLRTARRRLAGVRVIDIVTPAMVAMVIGASGMMAITLQVAGNRERGWVPLTQARN